MQAPGVQRPQGSSSESMCEGDHYQPHATFMGEQECQGNTGEALPAQCDGQSGQNCRLGQQPASHQAVSSVASGVDVNILEAQSAPPHGSAGPGRAAEAACLPQPAELSEEETVISDIPQRTGRRPLAGAARGARKRATRGIAVPDAAAADLQGGQFSHEGERAVRARRRAMRQAELAARSRQATKGSAADSLPLNDSSGLDGSQGAAWGLATMLQVQRLLALAAGAS